MSYLPDRDTEQNREIRYTVLGADGFIGSRLVRMLAASSTGYYAPTRNDSRVFKCNLGKVFYCIGLTADYAYRFFDTVEAHVTFLTRLLAQGRFEKLVYLSSTRLYDRLRPKVCREDEDLVFNPSNPRHIYDLSKALGENLCMTASEGRASVARLSCVYDNTPGSPGFLSELLQRLRAEREFTLDSSSGIVRDYVAIDDVLVALKAILDEGQNDVFNVGSGENVSNQEIIDALNSIGYRITLGQRSRRQSAVICDITKIKRFGFDPIPVRDYLKSFATNLGGFHETR